MVTRLWKLVLVLNGVRYGKTVAQLRSELEISRSTLYRDLDMLEAAGVGLSRAKINGEARIALDGLKTLAVAPTVLQVAALCLARDALTPLEGTAAVRELDALLAQWGRRVDAGLDAAPRDTQVVGPALVETIDAASRNRHRLVLEYQGARDEAPRRREVDPLVMRLEEQSPYLFGYCYERKGYRLFKLARIAAAHETKTPAGDHSAVDLEALLEHSVKVWLGDRHFAVVVRLSPSKARFAREYPLTAHQELEPQPDGAVLVRAEVNGLVEALRWVLSWGADAAVVAPQELRQAVRQELAAAAAHYADGPISIGAERVVSQSRDTGGA